MSGKQSSREAILDAAEAVVMQSGAAHLTLDAVAEAAGVSKGGLLYHFPSKDALVEGMIRRCVTQFEADSRATEQKLPDSPARDLKAYIQAALDDEGPRRQVNVALLAAGANNPELLQPVREHNRVFFSELASRKRGFERAVAVVLAAYGLWFLEALQLSMLSAKQRQRVVQEILALAESGA